MQSGKSIDRTVSFGGLHCAAVNRKTDGRGIVGACRNDGETGDFIAGLRHQGHGIAIAILFVAVETRRRRDGGGVEGGSSTCRVLGAGKADDTVDVTTRDNLSVGISLIREDKRHLISKDIADRHQHYQHEGGKALDLFGQPL